MENGGDNYGEESSTDGVDSEILDTPRGSKGGLETELLKSNTSLAHSGESFSFVSFNNIIFGEVVRWPW